MKLDELKNILRDKGVVGAGGAGFPSYAKLSDAVDTVILNCAECFVFYLCFRNEIPSI